MTTALHPLYSDLPRPSRLNNPFGYEPNPLCLQAASQLQAYLQSVDCWQEEIARGKMFGVLVVEDHDGQLGFLAAYSGLLAERNDWDYFVPAVFDFQQPDGYFKREETEISALNHQVDTLTRHPSICALQHDILQLEKERDLQTEAYKRDMSAAKSRRDAIRQSATPLDSDTEKRLIQESQYMKAELHRIKKRYDLLLEEKETELHDFLRQAEMLKKERRQRSDRLQRWLFDHFVMLNALGETKTLTEIFAPTTQGVPPSGAGECCAPKLLQYAYQHHLHPLCIGEFWWGQSPKAEIRRHLHYYSACRGKCHPILTFMLQGLDVEDNPHEHPAEAEPAIVYEDDSIMVVNKPAGMLSVPGKIEGNSVWSFVRSHCPKADGPLIVHRLDMGTSGLMLVAKTKCAHQNLQAQFKNRTVHKTYFALLEGRLEKHLPEQGVISLPLRPDPTDRPRQIVDHIHGKPAITEYEVVGTDAQGRTRIQLHPLTGRTHQLRLHCAHPDGLNCPIWGDTLYGHPADRLHLHAGRITFIHPESGEEMSFSISY